MTTPSTIGSILSGIRERLANAMIDAARSHDKDPNSYGAGYDAGSVDALRAILADITENPMFSTFSPKSHQQVENHAKSIT